MHATTVLDAEHIIEMMDAVYEQEAPVPGEGLRERKKRRLRQRISNVATALFLTEGFEEVSVARIAARCEVSEQTVFNHFPTKESMFFDRTDETTRDIGDAVRDPARGPLSEVILPPLSRWNRWPGIEERDAIAGLRQFAAVAVASPTLRAAPYLAVASFLDATAAALAERVGVASGRSGGPPHRDGHRGAGAHPPTLVRTPDRSGTIARRVRASGRGRYQQGTAHRIASLGCVRRAGSSARLRPWRPHECPVHGPGHSRSGVPGPVLPGTRDPHWSQRDGGGHLEPEVDLGGGRIGARDPLDHEHLPPGRGRLAVRLLLRSRVPFQFSSRATRASTGRAVSSKT